MSLRTVKRRPLVETHWPVDKVSPDWLWSSIRQGDVRFQYSARSCSAGGGLPRGITALYSRLLSSDARYKGAYLEEERFPQRSSRQPLHRESKSRPFLSELLLWRAARIPALFLLKEERWASTCRRGASRSLFPGPVTAAEASATQPRPVRRASNGSETAPNSRSSTQ